MMIDFYNGLFDFNDDDELDRGELAALHNHLEDEERELFGGDDDFDDGDSDDDW